ncbi:hypothetical protein T02_8488 [Trichinella nativa]|uniref:Uncharacterized protein n=1 Tax=Trichinella nativa TaxID=6335 RepID=A0A0V1LIV0_9BILA|nr:hypothetical protein T02_8488 [Trichinella nativa]
MRQQEEQGTSYNLENISTGQKWKNQIKSYQIHFFHIHLIIRSGILKNHILMYGHFGINFMHISITFSRLQD